VAASGGLPAPELFDVAGLADAFERVLRGPARAESVQYSVSEGHPELRERLAELTRARGASRPRGRTCWSPPAPSMRSTSSSPHSSAPARRSSSSARATSRRCSSCPLGAAGRVGRLRRGGPSTRGPRGRSARAPPELLYTVPTFQNPSGVTLSLERRREIARLADREGLGVVEDDPYGELRYHGEALPALTSLGGERTVYVSTLSKILAPGLRLGWILCPPSLREVLVVAKQAEDLHTSTVDQRAGAGYWQAVPSAPRSSGCATLTARLDAKLETLPVVLPGGSRWTRASGGMSSGGAPAGGGRARPPAGRGGPRSRLRPGGCTSSPRTVAPTPSVSPSPRSRRASSTKPSSDSALPSGSIVRRG